MEEENLFNTLYTEPVYSASPPVTVIIGIPWTEVREEDRQLLSKILQAVRLSLEAVRIVHQTTLDLSAWSEKPQQLIAFLAPPKGLTSYEVIQTGETSVIFSDPLEILNSDDAAKRKLWNILKSHFAA